METNHVKTDELKWAAGFFEGRGSWTRDGGRLQIRLTRAEPVRRFHEAVGVGAFYGPYGPYKTSISGGGKPFYMWVAQYPTDVRDTLHKLTPYFTPEFGQELLRRRDA